MADEQLIKLVFSDFDGTLTRTEELTPVFFDILGLLQEKGIPLVIVTGRNKYWGHFILTHFPSLEHILTENGGVMTSKKKTENPLHPMLTDEILTPPADIRRLEEFEALFVKQFPDIPFTMDSFGRKTDRAIESYDLNKDPGRRREVESFMRHHQVNFSSSNIHFHFWCGHISKYSAVRHFLDLNPQYRETECIFFGDSYNDETMFEHFKNSVAVSNIALVQDQLTHLPNTILQGEENIGPDGVFNHLAKCLR